MNAKFIGIDGYGKIEKLNNQKKNSSIKNIKKFFRICATIIKEDIIKSSRKVKTATNGKYTAELSKKFLRKKAILSSAIAILLCVLTTVSPVFAAEEAVKNNESITVLEPEDTSEAKVAQSFSNSAIGSFGYGLFIDGELAGVCVEKGQLEKELKIFLDEYKSKYDNKTTDEFANSVEVIDGYYETSYFAEACDIVANNKSKFSVSLETDVVMTQKIPFVTKTKYDNSQYEGYKKVIQNGINGKQKITYRVTYVDGAFSDSHATKIKTIKKAQNKIVVVGAKKKASYSSNTYSNYSSSSGAFGWPVPYTRNITSYYGPRWGSYHYGIDIAASGVNGQAIVASSSGTVTWAGWDNSGYGYYVVIDHGNGYSTLYGHCSAVYVSKGQSVSKGQTIAAVGSTGWSTGPHLHFEIRNGGTKLNPMNYL